ncbi:MAG: hypothetical protein IJ368_04695 [Oscillospiraceae bacterium]|nr:hypothetical protein [Oscillospiraceae bacterium]
MLASQSDVSAVNGSSANDRWKQRLSNLPEEEQVKISRKYYGGSMPWKQEAENGGKNGRFGSIQRK